MWRRESSAPSGQHGVKTSAPRVAFRFARGYVRGPLRGRGRGYVGWPFGAGTCVAGEAEEGVVVERALLGWGVGEEGPGEVGEVEEADGEEEGDEGDVGLWGPGGAGAAHAGGERFVAAADDAAAAAVDFEEGEGGEEEADGEGGEPVGEGHGGL